MRQLRKNEKIGLGLLSVVIIADLSISSSHNSSNPAPRTSFTRSVSGGAVGRDNGPMRSMNNGNSGMGSGGQMKVNTTAP